MPVYEPGRWLNPADRPQWCEISGAGRFTVVAGSPFERHRHDDHELWFIAAGKAKVEVDGAHQYVQAGDIVLTRAGEFHDFVEVYEPVSGFFTEIGVPAGGRTGHLDPEPHEVPGLPLPADFPVR